MECFVCDYELEPRGLFCPNCGQDLRLISPLHYSQKLLDKASQTALPQHIAANTYILAKNYIPNQFNNVDARYLQILDATTYIWTPYPDSAYEFDTRAEIDSVIINLRAANQQGPFQIMIRKGK